MMTKTETEDTWTLSSLLLCSGIFRQSVISRIIKIDIPDLFFGVTELTDLLTETLGSVTTLDSGGCYRGAMVMAPSLINTIRRAQDGYVHDSYIRNDLSTNLRHSLGRRVPGKTRT